MTRLTWWRSYWVCACARWTAPKTSRLYAQRPRRALHRIRVSVRMAIPPMAMHSAAAPMAALCRRVSVRMAVRISRTATVPKAAVRPARTISMIRRKAAAAPTARMTSTTSRAILRRAVRAIRVKRDSAGASPAAAISADCKQTIDFSERPRGAGGGACTLAWSPCRRVCGARICSL